MSAQQPEKEQPAKEPKEFGRPINDIIRDLSQPIHPSFLKKKKVGNRGDQVDYLPWYNATKLLDYFAPGWEHHVRIEHIGDKIVAIASLSIHAKEGVITREALGFEDDDKEGYGDPFSNSEGKALRRAAAKFGLARHLYSDKS